MLRRSFCSEVDKYLRDGTVWWGDDVMGLCCWGIFIKSKIFFLSDIYVGCPHTFHCIPALSIHISTTTQVIKNILIYLI